MKNRAENLSKQRELFRGKELGAFNFDGRKDKTKTHDGSRTREISEVHYSIVQEPGSTYIAHIEASGGAKPLCNAIIECFDNMSIDYGKLFAIGCDGTVENTGKRGGVIRFFEMHLERPCHWFICMLHENELPLRHLMTELDGKTTGPNAFSGPIGRAICKGNIYGSIVNFEKIPFECEIANNQLVSNSFSTDQKYLFRICTAISTGNFDDQFAKCTIGAISHSRWITLGSSILRLYATESEPSENLRIMAKFVVQVYAPIHFNIKANFRVTFGARHVADQIKLSRHFPKHE